MWQIHEPILTPAALYFFPKVVENMYLGATYRAQHLYFLFYFFLKTTEIESVIASGAFCILKPMNPLNLYHIS